MLTQSSQSVKYQARPSAKRNLKSCPEAPSGPPPFGPRNKPGPVRQLLESFQHAAGRQISSRTSRGCPRRRWAGPTPVLWHTGSRVGGLHRLLGLPPDRRAAARVCEDELGPRESGPIQNQIDGVAAAPTEQDLGLVHQPTTLDPTVCRQGRRHARRNVDLGSLTATLADRANRTMKGTGSGRGWVRWSRSPPFLLFVLNFQLLTPHHYLCPRHGKREDVHGKAALGQC